MLWTLRNETVRKGCIVHSCGGSIMDVMTCAVNLSPSGASVYSGYDKDTEVYQNSKIIIHKSMIFDYVNNTSANPDRWVMNV